MSGRDFHVHDFDGLNRREAAALLLSETSRSQSGSTVSEQYASGKCPYSSTPLAAHPRS